MIKKLFTLIIILSISGSTGLMASQQESIRTSQVRMPQVPPVSRTAAIYFTLENLTENAIQLTGVSTDVAHHAMIHQTVEEDGMSKMRHRDAVAIPANGKLVLQPGGMHIMLMGIDKTAITQPFELRLEFAQQAPLTISVSPTK